MTCSEARIWKAGSCCDCSAEKKRKLWRTQTAKEEAAEETVVNTVQYHISKIFLTKVR